jgi:hypothetical protein
MHAWLKALCVDGRCIDRALQALVCMVVYECVMALLIDAKANGHRIDPAKRKYMAVSKSMCLRAGIAF